MDCLIVLSFLSNAAKESARAYNKGIARADSKTALECIERAIHLLELAREEINGKGFRL